jgi:hypothetical protein
MCHIAGVAVQRIVSCVPHNTNSKFLAVWASSHFRSVNRDTLGTLMEQEGTTRPYMAVGKEPS